MASTKANPGARAARPGAGKAYSRETDATTNSVAAPTAQPPIAGGGPALSLGAITISPECQLRAASSAATVTDYAEAIAAGAIFPPVVVYFDGSTYWLADGFHRLEAHREAGLAEIPVEIHDGGQRDAVLFAAGANSAHGLRRTQADKARAIATLLADPEWRKWSDKEVARRAGVSDKSVGKARRELSGIGGNGALSAEIRADRVEHRKFVSKHGTLATRRVVLQAEPLSTAERILRGLPDDVLLAEARRRGFVVEGA